MSFLDVIARQVLALREEYAARLPLIFMNSFRTSADCMAALAPYTDLAVEGLPLEFLQNKEPKLRADDLTPVTWEADPDLEWCPPGHGDIYTALRGTGLLQQLIEAGYTQVFVSNSDNLGAVPDARVAGWFARSGAPFAIEAVRRTPSDRKGGHFATRKSDGRIVLRSDCYELSDGFVLEQQPEAIPYVDLDSKQYKLVADFDQRFPEGPPSMRRATSLVVHGDWTFEKDVTVVGDVELDPPSDGAGRVKAGTTLGEG
jgi:UDP-N-acetylglucosamine pyrophosphorylase